MRSAQNIIFSIHLCRYRLEIGIKSKTAILLSYNLNTIAMVHKTLVRFFFAQSLLPLLVQVQHVH